MGRIRLLSYCKINLCLEVLGRRDDGYHEVATVLQTVSLADELSMHTAAAGDLLTVPGGGAPAGPDNLCCRALSAYRTRRAWPPGARIVLHKRVPAGAGLGGGSSNAAATLCGLARLDPDPPDPGALLTMAVDLGSDVPFFLEGGTVLATGRGEIIQRLPDLADLHLVLAWPRLSISTAQAYSLLQPRDFTDGSRARTMAQLLRQAARAEVLADLVHNAFTPALMARWPQVTEVLEVLRDVGALKAEVSGSGSACFGLLPGPEEAEDAAIRLQALGIRAVAAQAVGQGWAVQEEATGETDV